MKIQTLVDYFGMTDETLYDKQYSGTAEHDGLIFIRIYGKYGWQTSQSTTQFIYTCQINDIVYHDSELSSPVIEVYPIYKGWPWSIAYKDAKNVFIKACDISVNLLYTD